jgi:hypothetical protein
MEQPLLQLPQELLGEILVFLSLKDICSLASTSTKWNNLAWAKISHLDIPDRLKNPLVIFKKCSPKSIFSLALDLTDEVEDGSDYVQLLTEFKYLTNLQVSAPRLGTSELYDAIYQLTQLKCLDLVDNNVDDGNRFARMTALKKITELGITAEGHDFELLPIEELTHLKTLKLPFSDTVDDHCLDRILTLTQLEFLDLTWCSKITHNSFSKIVKMTNLTKLDLSRCLEILAPSFKSLIELPRLRCLDLSYHHTLTSKELNIISQYSHLTCLYLVSNHGLTIDSNEYIARMSNLRELHLEGREDRLSLSLLTGLTNLRVLYTGVKSDRPSIALLTHLVQLDLYAFEDKDLAWLSTMAWLKQLHITGSGFSAESVKKLTGALLNTAIILPSNLI